MKYLFTLLLWVCPLLVFVQNVPKAVLEGVVTDDVGETLIGASVKLMKGDTLLRGSITNINGRYRLLLDPGVYRVEWSYTGFTTVRMEGISIMEGENTLPVIMSSGTLIDGCGGIFIYWPPLISQEPGNVGTTLESYQLRGWQ